MNVVMAEDYHELSVLVAQKIATHINHHPDALVCFAAGDTPLRMLRELVAMQERKEVDLSSVWYAGLDEWVGLGIDDIGSCVKVMTDVFYGPANIPKERIHLFDGLDSDTDGQCRVMEEWIASHGGIGLTLLGIGMNGHIGFNEPGIPDTKGCFTVPLDDTTKSVSAKYFGEKRPVTTGITIGWHELMQARNAILMACGETKAPIVKASLKGKVTADVPASLFQNHKSLTVMLDNEAASLL